MRLLHAQSLETMNSAPAPEEWERINVIAAARPDGLDIDSVSLQQLDESMGICLWMVKQGHEWHPASGFFQVSEF